MGGLIVVLGGLVVWSYGFNNIPLPLGGVAIPAVDAFIAYALVASRSTWRQWTSPLGRRVLWLLIAISAVALGRLAVDVPRFGPLAARDALYVLEAWGVVVGYAWGRLWGAERLERLLAWLWRLAVLWFLLYPFREIVESVSPVLGVQRPTPLFAFTSIGLVATVAVLWFVEERRSSSRLFAVLALAALLLSQSRGAYLGLFFTLVVGFSMYRASSVGKRGGAGRRPGVRVIVVGGLAFVIFAVLPPLPGRMGEAVGLATVTNQIGTIFGEEGLGAGSVEHRREAWPMVVKRVTSDPTGPILGVGYGPDLFQGFFSATGVEVRKPHNDLLEIWARVGLLGAIPWLALVTTVGVACLRRAVDRRLGWWVIALQATMLVTSLTQPAFGFAYLGLTYWVLSGAVLGTHEREGAPVIERGAGSEGAPWPA